MKKTTLAALAVVALTSVSAFAADTSKLVLPGDITLEQATRVIEAAKAKAKQTDTLMNIAVVDAGGNLKAFARMEGAFLGSVDISIGKAKTARLFNMPTKDLGALAQVGQPLYGIEVTNRGLVIFGGGELLRDKSGTIIGAVGVSGSSVENDMAVAQAGAAGL
jgi:uncharacterized protein GlcG (DUF336 family)